MRSYSYPCPEIFSYVWNNTYNCNRIEIKLVFNLPNKSFSLHLVSLVIHNMCITCKLYVLYIITGTRQKLLKSKCINCSYNCVNRKTFNIYLLSTLIPLRYFAIPLCAPPFKTSTLIYFLYRLA